MCLSGFRDFLFSVIEKPFNELIDESILSVLLPEMSTAIPKFRSEGASLDKLLLIRFEK